MEFPVTFSRPPNKIRHNKVLTSFMILMLVMALSLLYIYHLPRQPTPKNPRPAPSLKILKKPNNNINNNNKNSNDDRNNNNIDNIKNIINNNNNINQNIIDNNKKIINDNRNNNNINNNYRNNNNNINQNNIDNNNNINNIINTNNNNNNINNSSKVKKILIWNPMVETEQTWDSKRLNKGGECVESRCYMTTDRNEAKVEDYDAILFTKFKETIYFPRNRPANQIYILEEVGSGGGMIPSFEIPKLESYANKFNLIIAHREEADIERRRIEIQPLKNKSISEFYATRNMAENRTRLAAWVVSHCDAHSGRRNLVDKLQEYIPVDIYGKCGTLLCSGDTPLVRIRNSWPRQSCFEMIEKTYKFYLSFENSLCHNYISEKFYFRIREDVVPVVYGLGNYERIAPPYSYIDATAFKSAEDLANYLLYLDKNDTAYNEYFSWRKDFEVVEERLADRYCQLCEILHSDLKPKIYKNLTEWFTNVSYCEKPSVKDGEYYMDHRIVKPEE